MKSKWVLALLAGLFVTVLISAAQGQTEPHERPRRPSRVGDGSTLQKEKITKIKSPLASEAARQKNGAMKAMLFIDRNGQVVRCFNSLLDEAENSQLPCGFKVERLSTDYGFKIDFGFRVNDRFVLTTPVIVGARFNSENASQTTAPFTFHPDESNVIVALLSRPETALMVFVY